MKKLTILALAALLVVAAALPASALENEFGGYWRARFYNQGQFDGEDGDADNRRRADTRTRLYYTARINDNLKFVNKFEMDAVFGENEANDDLEVLDAAGNPTGDVVEAADSSLYGDPGADGVRVEVKNTYADFNTGPVNWTVGVQPYALFREFYISTDAAGIIGRWKVADNFIFAASWLKQYEGGAGDGNNEDIDSYTATAAFWFNENISIKPSVSYATSSELDTDFVLGLLDDDSIPAVIAFEDLSLFTYGVDFDMSFDNFGLWATLVGQSGEAKVATAGVDDIDFKGYLAAVGGNVMLGPVELHGQAFYATGDDEDLADDQDYDAFFNPYGSYYWSEIMGQGIFDVRYTANNNGDIVNNMIVFGVGASMAPMEKLKVSVDLWYAMAEEDIEFADGSKEDEYGTELDVVVTYQLVEGLNLDLVGAYMWAGDATSADGNNDEDPYEFGAQLSLSF